ncbi:MAG TPA: PQQ-binding-like beta-propeller repeat protein, partial [Clostridia bacterium]|nr:PQQ-binding-like beta-propeller repeat protein [Clostridia bacterium]
AVKQVKRTIQPATVKYWGNMFGELSDWGTSSKSGFLVLDESIYFACDNIFYRLNKQGEVTGQTTLTDYIGYTARPAYGNGLVVVPLNGGALEAVDPDTMKTVWTSDGPGEVTASVQDDQGHTTPTSFPLQNSSSLYIDKGLCYSLTLAMDDNWMSIGGYVHAVDMATGDTVWVEEDRASENGPAGFNMSGAVVIGDWFVTIGEKGELAVRDALTGTLKGTENLDSKVNSSLVQQGNLIYFTTFDGRLVECELDETLGTTSKKRETSFAVKSTSSPAIYKGKVYVGGLSDYGDWETGVPATGLFVVIDLSSMEVEKTFEVEGGEVQSAPLVAVGKDKTPLVYFTANNEVGGLYLFDGDDVKRVFEPDLEGKEQNFTLFSPVIDQNGTVYYSNDSGYIFALAEQVPPPAASGATATTWLIPVIVGGVVVILLAVFLVMKSKSGKKTK